MLPIIRAVQATGAGRYTMSPSPPKLTIVMYHYVRPLALSRFPKIKGLDLTLFERAARLSHESTIR